MCVCGLGGLINGDEDEHQSFILAGCCQQGRDVSYLERTRCYVKVGLVLAFVMLFVKFVTYCGYDVTDV